jgi:hypothetical protein
MLRSRFGLDILDHPRITCPGFDPREGTKFQRLGFGRVMSSKKTGGIIFH